MKNGINNAFYTCPYCNEEYSTPVDLAHCILSCEDKKKKEAEDAKKAKLAIEKEARIKEIETAEKHYHELIKNFVKDYGSYNVSRSYNNDDALFSLKPWSWVF
jgi:hypothetical protein